MPRLLFLLPVAIWLAMMANAGAAEVPPPTGADGADELVHADGDRVRGRFLRREGDLVVFQSNHFGEVRVREAEVKLVLAPPPVAVAAKPAAEPTSEEAVGEETGPAPWYHLRPIDLALRLRSVFGSWHGRLALSSEAITDSSDRSTVAVEGSLRRNWKRDELKMNLRYDYAETNEETSTDLLRGDATWNHSLGRRWYTVYRPSLEWNRVYTNPAGVPIDYVLLQQEVGLGLSVYKGPRGKLSIGVAENLFDVWTTAGESGRHFASANESLFAETEWKLPWQVTISDRGVMYYSAGEAGWENRFQIDKKLSDTFSVGVSHELRRNNPDMRVSDYTKARIMLGIDF